MAPKKESKGSKNHKRVKRPRKASRKLFVPMGDGLGRRMNADELIRFGRHLDGLGPAPVFTRVAPSTRPARIGLDLFLDPIPEVKVKRRSARGRKKRPQRRR